MTANKYHNSQHLRGQVIYYSGSQRGGCETAFTAVAPEGDGLTGREGLLLLKGSWISVLRQNIRSLWRKMIHLEATWREREALRGQTKHTFQMHLGDYFLQPGPTLNCPLGKNSSVD